MFKSSIILLFFVAWALAAKPMESIKNYNVVLAHGAADMRSGLDCKNGENDGEIKEAYDYRDKKDTLNTDYLNRIGGYKDWVLFWEDNNVQL